MFGHGAPTECHLQSNLEKKSIVINRTTWNSMIHRSVARPTVTFTTEVKGLQLAKEPQPKNCVDAKPLLQKPLPDSTKENFEIDTRKLSLSFEKINELFSDGTKETITGQGNTTAGISLRRRKLDEYKMELRDFIESKRQQEVVLSETEREKQRMEQISTDLELKNQLREEEIEAAERKAARRNVELESILLSRKTNRYAMDIKAQLKKF